MASGLVFTASPTLRGAMAPHENLFFVEKHYNDSLYRGQRKGTTHTDREIQAAANLLGRRGVVADERAAVAALSVRAAGRGDGRDEPLGRCAVLLLGSRAAYGPRTLRSELH